MTVVMYRLWLNLPFLLFEYRYSHCVWLALCPLIIFQLRPWIRSEAPSRVCLPTCKHKTLLCIGPSYDEKLKALSKIQKSSTIDPQSSRRCLLEISYGSWGGSQGCLLAASRITWWIRADSCRSLGSEQMLKPKS